jgi:bifunctional dihydroflavonol 4-reductase/flavanone 4-reductase
MSRAADVANNSKYTVVVTGASGFLGSFIVKQALESGYNVRACVRNPSDKEKTEHLTRLDATGTRLTLWKADLLQKGSYDDACKGAHFVIHAAAVVEIAKVEDPQKMIGM